MSSVSLIEITYLVEKGRLPNQALVSLKNALQDTKTAIKPISIGLEIATAIGQINRNTVPDMPDRIIAATALTLNLPLVTRDSKIQQTTNIHTIW
jgi:PIN domain nuclease of toxin-antitoxin system